MLEESLDTELDRFLGRKWYARRWPGKRQETGISTAVVVGVSVPYVNVVVWTSTIAPIKAPSPVCAVVSPATPTRSLWSTLAAELLSTSQTP